MIWQTSRFSIDLTSPRVMGIVNVTPDSFSDGGRYLSADGNVAAALAHCEQLIRDGADLLDIGGESSRPGAPPVPLAEELARVQSTVAVSGLARRAEGAQVRYVGSAAALPGAVAVEPTLEDAYLLSNLLTQPEAKSP